MRKTRKKQRLLALSKQPFFRRMDKLSHDRHVVEAAVHDLTRKTGASLLDLGVVHDYVRGAAETSHVRSDWLDARSGWWRDLPAVEPILRAAFIKAGRLILKHRLPLDCYWVRGTEEFQVVVTKSAYQITMLICSPIPVAKRPIGRTEEANDIWVFASGGSD